MDANASWLMAYKPNIKNDVSRNFKKSRVSLPVKQNDVSRNL